MKAKCWVLVWPSMASKSRQLLTSADMLNLFHWPLFSVRSTLGCMQYLNIWMDLITRAWHIMSVLITFNIPTTCKNWWLLHFILLHRMDTGYLIVTLFWFEGFQFELATLQLLTKTKTKTPINKLLFKSFFSVQLNPNQETGLTMIWLIIASHERF